ncbi:MAG: flavodoxin family protein [Granulosicoccus sp.]|nr:flavodoxin family protein [Granulosicoccus sp.]
MTHLKSLLIVANQPSANTKRLAEVTATGARHPDIDSVHVIVREPLQAHADDVLNCHGIIIGTTENFGYMSGLIKDFFERIYYPCLEKTEALPYALYVRAGNDGQGTRNAVQRIVTGLCWSEAQPCLILKGDYQTSFETQCEELGATMAMGMEAGIY